MIKISKIILPFCVFIITSVCGCDYSMTLTIQGKVTDTEGQAIEKATVELWWNFRSVVEERVITNENGEYDLRLIYKDEEKCPHDLDDWVLVANKEGYFSYSRTGNPLECTENVQRFNFTLIRSDSMLNKTKVDYMRTIIMAN